MKQREDQFNFMLPSVALERRRTKFMRKFCVCSVYVAGAAVYHWYIHTDIALSLHFLYFFVYCSITIIVIFATLW